MIRKVINILCAAIVLFSGNVFAESIDSEKSTAEPVPDSSHTIAAEYAEGAKTDKFEVCAFPARSTVGNPVLKTESCEPELFKSNIKLDEKEKRNSHKLDVPDIRVDSKTDSSGTHTSTHSLPWPNVNPNPGLIVFHDDNRKDKLFYSVLSFTIKW